jgi:transposase InsO family protein
VAQGHAGPDATRSPDLVNRDFTADRPNQLWVADFTYLRCWRDAVLSLIIDVFSRCVVGWHFASHMRTDLGLDALRMALTRRRAGADSRPSSSHIASGAPVTSSSWRSSSTSPGSTPPAHTRRSMTDPRRKSNPSTLPGPF